jgi:hypothetical protein
VSGEEGAAREGAAQGARTAAGRLGVCTNGRRGRRGRRGPRGRRSGGSRAGRPRARLPGGSGDGIGCIRCQGMMGGGGRCGVAASGDGGQPAEGTRIASGAPRGGG